MPRCYSVLIFVGPKFTSTTATVSLLLRLSFQNNLNMLFVAPFFDVQYRKTLKTSENVRNVNLLRTHDASPWLDFFLLKKNQTKGRMDCEAFFSQTELTI
jgi:hypothetical protein